MSPSGNLGVQKKPRGLGLGLAGSRPTSPGSHFHPPWAWQILLVLHPQVHNIHNDCCCTCTLNEVIACNFLTFVDDA